MNTPTTPTIIGLTGLAGTGKDTVRAILEEHDFVGFAFADPIRAMIRELLLVADIDPARMDDRNLKELPIYQLSSDGKPVSYRMLAQTLGTEWARGIQPDFWLRIAQSYMDGIRSMTFGDMPRFVVSDVRFQNEADWVRAQGGTIWRVDRPGVAPVRAHASEAEVAQIAHDGVIVNAGSIHDLRLMVLRVLRSVYGEVASYGAPA